MRKVSKKETVAVKNGNSPSKQINPALAGLLLAFCGFFVLLLLGMASDGREIVELGGYVQDKLRDGGSFDWSMHSALIAGLIPGAILWNIIRKDFTFSVMPGGNSGRIVALLSCAAGGIAGGVLMMTGIRVSGITLFMALQNAVLLSGRAAVFIFSAACSAFFIAMLMKRLGRGESE